MGEWKKMRELFLVEDLNPHLPYVELVGDRRVLIENHQGILEYSDTVMRVAVGGMELCISGENMDLRVLTLHELTIAGTIRSLEYICRSKEGEHDTQGAKPAGR